MTTSPRCSTCKWWTGRADDDRYSYTCKLLTSARKVQPGVIDVCLDYSCTCGWARVDTIDTRADFGCVLHEEKES